MYLVFTKVFMVSGICFLVLSFRKFGQKCRNCGRMGRNFLLQLKRRVAYTTAFLLPHKPWWLGVYRELRLSDWLRSLPSMRICCGTDKRRSGPKSGLNCVVSSLGSVIRSSASNAKCILTSSASSIIIASVFGPQSRGSEVSRTLGPGPDLSVGHFGPGSEVSWIRSVRLASVSRSRISLAALCFTENSLIYAEKPLLFILAAS